MYMVPPHDRNPKNYFWVCLMLVILRILLLSVTFTCLYCVYFYYSQTCWIILCSFADGATCTWMTPTMESDECLQKWGSRYDKTPSSDKICRHKTIEARFFCFVFFYYSEHCVGLQTKKSNVFWVFKELFGKNLVFFTKFPWREGLRRRGRKEAPN